MLCLVGQISEGKEKGGWILGREVSTGRVWLDGIRPGEESVGTNFPSKSMDSLSAQKRAESEESTL